MNCVAHATESSRRPPEGRGAFHAAFVGSALLGVAVALWAFPALGQSQADGDAEGRLYLPPDPRTVAFHRQSLEKARLAQDVLDGRKTFGDAVAAFQAIHAAGPQRGSLFKYYRPGCSEVQAVQWNVLAFLRCAAREWPDKAAQVERIERELNRLANDSSS